MAHGSPINRHYPVIQEEKEIPLGFLPVDFILEVTLKAGLQHFRDNAEVANEVYGHLIQGFLAPKYGQNKVDEIREYINSNEIRIIQGFPQASEQSPTISLNLNDASEDETYAGMDDHETNIDVLGADGGVVGRTEIGYAPIKDSILIGLHAVGGPDKLKYLYYLVAYILMSFKDQLEERGLCLATFRATDISRLNDFLPEHMFSRFITYSTLTTVRFKKAEAPILDDFILKVDTSC